MKHTIPLSSAGVLLAMFSMASAPLQAQTVTIPKTYVLPTSAADTSKPGFVWHISEVASTGAYDQNSTARAEAQLQGLLGDNLADPSATGAASAPASPPNPSSAPISFTIPGFIDLDIATGHGDFANDVPFPGLPGTGGSNDNAAGEALTWLNLPAGDTVMGVNSDDGFTVIIGGGRPSDKVGGVLAGVYEGGRGSADSLFTIHVDQAGLYAARMLWYNGGGDANVEWFTEKADGTKVLINDAANGGVLAYQAVTGASAAFVSSVSPDANATGILPNASITAQIQDGATAVDSSSISLSFDGAPVQAQTSKSGSVTTVSYTPPSLFTSLSTHTASLTFSDGTPKTVSWSFTVASFSSVPTSMKVTPDTSKPGFIFRVSHVSAIPDTWRNPVTGYVGDGNSNDRAELQLAGLLLDDNGVALPNMANPAVQGVASAAGTAPNPAYAPISYEIPTVINMSAAPANTGNFPSDGQMPGMPGTDGLPDNTAASIITYLDLPAGLITMGVHSDDGFRTQLGTDAVGSVRLGEYEGARDGGGDTIFTFFVQEAGVYPFRTVWENGTGTGADIEWYTVQNGKNVLINDTANSGIKAYRALASGNPARISYVAPIAGMRWLNHDYNSLNILVADGTSAIDTSSVSLVVDGQTNNPTVTREGSSVRIVWTPTGLQVPTAVHTATLAFKDAAGTASTSTWQFRSLKNIVLPAPVVGENFDSTAEGSVPTGWLATNYTDCLGDYCTTPGENLDDLSSDTYKGWVVVDRTRLDGLKSRIFANVEPGQTVNGQPVDHLGDGNVLYAESDTRGGNQVQFIVSKAFNLASVKHATISFDCIEEQNQDDINSLEYSVDGGNTWLPIFYFLDGTPTPDIKLNADGTVNATHTMEDANADTASWTDPVTGLKHGGKYGDFIGAPITEALAPYIVSRVNDDQVEGKRVEVFRLWQADGKSDVRLRMAQGGTGSWYFGFDNINFYDADAPGTAPGAGGSTTTPTVSVSRSGSNLSVTFTGTLQSADTVTGPYTDVSGATSPASVSATGAAKFYRARQ